MSITVNAAATNAAAKYPESKVDVTKACEEKAGNPDMAGSLQGDWQFMKLTKQDFQGKPYDAAVFGNGDNIKLLALSALYKRVYDANGNTIEVKNPILVKEQDYRFEQHDAYVPSWLPNGGGLEVANTAQKADDNVKKFTNAKGERCVLKAAKYSTFSAI